MTLAFGGFTLREESILNALRNGVCPTCNVPVEDCECPPCWRCGAQPPTEDCWFKTCELYEDEE